MTEQNRWKYEAQRATTEGAMRDHLATIAAFQARCCSLIFWLHECKEYLQQDPSTVGGRPEAERLVKRINEALNQSTSRLPLCMDAPDGAQR